VRIRPLVLCTLLLSLLAVAADAKEYSAERFDSRIEVTRGGTLRVTETVRLRFDDGTFTQFFREIPLGLNDGIDIVSATMDDNVMTAGEGAGHIEIRRASGVRVTWHFAPVSRSLHTFTLTYLVRGAVRQEADADLLAWRVMPSQHAYRIDAGTIDIDLPHALVSEPGIETHNGSFTVEVEDARVRVHASAVRENGWVEVRVRTPLGSIIDAPPAWQQRQVEIRAHASTWAAFAAVILFAGLALLFGVRQGYDAPPRDTPVMTASGTLPETLAPAVAGALLTNGSPHLEHAMASLFALADRGEITIEEQPRSFGQRNFILRRAVTRGSLSPYDQRALDLIFGAGHGPESSISLKKGRDRLQRRFGTFSAAVRADMTARGLMDEGRIATRRRFLAIGIGSFISAPVTLLLAGLFASGRFGAWPMLLPLALVVVAVTAFICYASHTPLSNDAVRRAQAWRAFRDYLREVSHDRGTAPADTTLRDWLPYVVAMGLAPSWATYMKRHQGVIPPWFRALANQDRSASFTSFVAMSGAGAGGGHHGGAGAGGAAGGGGSSGAH
jgi:Predicted membrane protein (DUF2207)